MTYPKFEDIWQSKFQNAEEVPSKAVWEAIAWQIGYQERQRKKWIAWWAAALIAFFLGDGRLVYNFYGKFFEYTEQKEFLAERSTPINQQRNEEVKKILVIQKKGTDKATNQATTNQASQLLTAEAAYELSAEKIASKRPQEEIAEEALIKPKQRAWWLKNYANAQYIQPSLTYTPQLSLAARMMPNLQSVQKEQMLQKEIASFRHIFSWGAGVELGWHFHRHFYVSSGVHWQRSLFAFESSSQTPELAQLWGRLPKKTQSYSLQPPPIIETALPEETVMNIAAEPVQSPIYHFKQKMDFLTIPIKLGYQKAGYRWQYSVAVGLENNFLLDNTFQSADATFSQVYQNTNRWQRSALAEISVAVRLNHKLALHVSPTYRQFLDGFNASSSFQFNAKSWGVGAGLQLGL